MDVEAYQQFERFQAAGLKRQAKAALARFIDSMAEFEDKVRWTHWYFEQEYTGELIRHELYEQILFPVLLEGFERRDPWSMKKLALTMSNISQARSLWPVWQAAGDVSPHDLLKEVLRLCPEDDEARKALLSMLVKWYSFSVHEWPRGILNGMNGADAEASRDILAEVVQARQLDREGHYTEFLDDYAGKVRSWLARIEAQRS